MLRLFLRALIYVTICLRQKSEIIEQSRYWLGGAPIIIANGRAARPRRLLASRKNCFLAMRVGRRSPHRRWHGTCRHKVPFLHPEFFSPPMDAIGPEARQPDDEIDGIPQRHQPK